MAEHDNKFEVKYKVNGSLKLFGKFELTHPDGRVEVLEYASFCRCGLSKKMPLCDGEHRVQGWVAPEPETE